MLAESVLRVRGHVLLGQSLRFVVEVDSRHLVDPSELGNRVTDQVVVGDIHKSALWSLRPSLHGPFDHPVRLVAPVPANFCRIDMVAEHAPAMSHHAAKGGDGNPGIAVGLYDGDTFEHLEEHV